MQTEALKRESDEYRAFLQFAQECNGISYSEFDQYTLQRLNLFVVPKDEHFSAMESALDKIIQALPALKRIFTKPITRLKDVHNILPVESVRVINNESVVHVSLHSELWGDVTKEGLKPRKLMTLDRQEDYAIYENVAFARLVNMILAYVRKNIRLLKDIMYAYRDLHFNLLERTNHLNYFLAIGKLHMGYARAQDKYHLAYERCLEKLLFIDRTIRAKLHAPVYRHCKKNKAKLTLKKTNVFRLHKDYRQVYVLLKWFGEGKEEIDETLSTTGVSEAEYAAYCNLLSVFAVGHFNFGFDKRQKFDFTCLKAKGSYLGWVLRLETVKNDGIVGLRFSFSKERVYRICLLFSYEAGYDPVQVENFKKAHKAEEYLLAGATEYGAKNYVYLSLFDIDSFRRIQQLVLRGMVYSDGARDICPFCGKPLVPTKGGYECSVCRTQIFGRVCPETGEEYSETAIKDLNVGKRTEQTSGRDKFLFEKYAESLMYYRNITPLTSGGDCICPKCGKVHK